MKNLCLFLAIIIYVSCDSNPDSSSVYHKQILDEDTTAKYTLSKPYNIDFNVCGATYAILYKYAKPFDSALLYSGVFFIGSDSVLYVQVQSADDLFTTETNATKSNDITGTITSLTLYDGERFNYFAPTLFNTLLSAFFYEDYNIYYWGFTNDSTFACRYNIITKAQTKVYITKTMGTDDIAAFDPPIKKAHNIEFRTAT